MRHDLSLQRIPLLLFGHHFPPGAGEESPRGQHESGAGPKMTASWVLLDRRTGRSEPPGQKEQPEQSSLWCRSRSGSRGSTCLFPPPVPRCQPPSAGQKSGVGEVAAHCSLGASWCTGTATERSSVPSGSGGRESGPPKATGIIIVMLTRTTVTAAAATI